MVSVWGNMHGILGSNYYYTLKKSNHKNSIET